MKQLRSYIRRIIKETMNHLEVGFDFIQPELDYDSLRQMVDMALDGNDIAYERFEAGNQTVYFLGTKKPENDPNPEATQEAFVGLQAAMKRSQYPLITDSPNPLTPSGPRYSVSQQKGMTIFNIYDGSF